MSTDPTRIDPGSLGDGAAPRADVPAGVSGPDAELAGDGGPASETAHRPWARRVGRVLLGLVAVVALVVVGALVFLQTGAGRTFARGLVVGQITKLLADDAEVSLDRLDGNFLTGARMVGLEIGRAGETVIAVDTLLVDYNLRTLFNQTFSASQLYIGGPRAIIRQRADSTFNVVGLLKPSEEQSTLTIILDELAVHRGHAEIHWYRADGRDSVHTVTDIEAVVKDFTKDPESLEGAIDALALRALAPFDRGEVRVAGAGRFSNEDVELRSLAVTSRAGTDVRGTTRLVFTGDGSLPVFDATIEAAPLALEDARAFAGVEVYGDPRMRIRAESDGDLLTTSISGALDEATINIDGEFSREADGPVGYRAEGTLRRFDPSVITRNPALAAEVTGDLRVNLRGSSLETLSGPFNVTLRETRVGGRQIDRLALDGSFAAGRVSFDLDGALPGASLSAEGRARPFDDVPTFEVAGDARDVDLGVLLPGSGRTDTFAGTFAVVGRGASADDFSGTVAVDLDRATVGLPNGPLRFDDLQLDADVRRGQAAFDADATLAGGDGRVVASGEVELGDPLRYEIEQGRLVGVNVAALTGDPAQASDLTGTFTLSGRGTDPQEAPIDVTVSLRNSSFGAYDLAAADLDLRLRRGVAAVDAAVDLGPSGAVTVEGSARPFADPLAFDLRGTMRNLDLSGVTGNPDQASDLTGAFTAAGAGIDPATMRLDANLRITEPSSFGDRFVDAADVDVTLRAGALALNGTLETPEGELDLALSGRPFDANPSFAFENTCFRRLDLSDFAEASPRTSLNGCFSGQVAGLADLPTATADGVLTLRPSRVNEAQIDDGRVQFTLARGALDGTLRLDLVGGERPGQPESGTVTAAFDARPFDDEIRYAVRGTTEGLDAGVLLDLPPDQPLFLSTSFDLEGRGTDPATATIAGSLTGRESTVGPVALEALDVRFALADGIVRVDTLSIDSDLVTVVGGGTLALFNDAAPSDFRLEGEIESLAPLASLTEQTVGLESGSFDLTVSAAPGAPLAIVGTAQARQIVFGEYGLTGLDADLDLTWDRAMADSLGIDALGGQAQASFDLLTTETLRIQRGDGTLRVDDGDLVVDASVTVDDRRDFAVAGRVDLETNGVTLETGEVQIDSTTWQLLQPAQITLDEGIVDVRGLILAANRGGQQIAADGQIDFSGEQSFVVTVENVSIDALTDLAGFDALGGDLSATLVMSGPAAAPLIDGTVTLDGLTSRGQPVGALAATLAYAGDQLTIDAALTHVDGETLTIDGAVPLQFSLADGPESQEVRDDAEVSLVARADAFPIAWARPFLDDRAYNALGGTLRLDLTVTGTQASPRLDGVATLSDGRLGVVATGRVYEPIQADVSFQNDRIGLDDVRILDEDGRTALDVTGEIRLRELSVGELDLTIVPRDFVAMDTRTFDGLTLDRGTEPLRLTGTLDAPVLRGSVALARGDIYLTDELVPPDLDPVELTDAQIREVEARFGRVIAARDTAVSRFTDALAYNLTVEIRENVWLRANSGLPFDIEFSGDVEARKRSYAESGQVFGRIELTRGTIQTLSRRFELEDGSITLNGDALAAIVDIAATLDIRLAGTIAGQSSATITLAVNGQLDDNPSIRLSSDPSMEAADIVSLIATGRLAGDFSGGGGIAGAGLGVGIGALSGVAEGLASEKLGLEVAQIDYEGTDLVIKFGDYLSTKAFWTLGAIVPLGSTSQGEQRLPFILGLDYELLSWLQAQTEYSGQRGLGGGLGVETAW
ncbi:translocation/assembly module TamB domain-containing protein [Rubrivirga sp.]|uniref:translocation/assembly module TamB domain-containing protein n=1 Tax=Rubrivirga sp. TaxID=1885344 RepID=UPI003B51BB77